MPSGALIHLGIPPTVSHLFLTAAVPLEPSTVREISAPVRATAGAALVLVFGAVLISATNSLIDRSIDASLESVSSSVFYGLSVHFVLVFAGAYIISQIAGRVDGGSLVVVGLTGIGLMTAAGLGFTVVGSALTELAGDRRPWLGLGIGTAIAAASLLALPLVLGLGVWVLVVSVGIGGSAREWFHASHSSVDDVDELT